MIDRPDYPEHVLRLIDRDLAGELSAVERAELDRLASGDPSLARELSVQRRFASTLRQQIVPPAPPAIPMGPGAGPITGAGSGIGAGSMLAIVGGLVVAAAVTGVVLTRSSSGPQTTGGVGSPGRAAPEESVYTQGLSCGFTPGFKLTNPGTIAEALTEKLGVDIALEDSPGLVYRGFSGADGVSPMSLAVMASLHGHDALVVFTPTGESDHAVHTAPVAGQPGVYRHEIVRAKLRVCEISSEPTPGLLPRVRVREAPSR